MLTDSSVLRLNDSVFSGNSAVIDKAFLANDLSEYERGGAALHLRDEAVGEKQANEWHSTCLLYVYRQTSVHWQQQQQQVHVTSQHTAFDMQFIAAP
jgi:hypothetical protein